MAYQRLFVVVDPSRDSDPALRRAASLLTNSGGHIHAYCSVYESDLSDYESRQEGKRTLRDQARAKLDTLVEPLTSAGVQVEAEVEWSSEPGDAAMRACSRIGADLLLKSAGAKHGREAAHLLRHSPAPVLLVRGPGDQPYRTVLAAVAVEDNDRKHDTLNNHVVSQARRLCNTTGAQLHTVSALEGAPSVAQILKIMEDHDEEKLSAEEMIAQSFGVARDAAHIDYGPAKAVIAETAETINADVLIIGTVARSGLSGAIIGNTCEKVLEAVDLDTLIVS
jgi:universal stress protein E